jgi:hypothetical protein
VNNSIPSCYVQIPAGELTAEANQTATLPKPYNADLLPFHLLGGRRFEILTYLYFLDEPPEQNAAVTLVKSSGDMGRDVLIHCDGSLRTVIQCKALEDALSRPALVRELVKLALFNRLEHFLPQTEFEYQIWAPGGLNDKASTLVAEWPNAFNEKEVKAAFEATVEKYKSLSSLLWSDCREDLLLNFPLSVSLVSRDGVALSHRIQGRKDLLTQFFDVNVVIRKEDLAATLRELGVRPSYDADVLRVLEDIESIPQDRRVYLGMHSFGLSLQHFAMMNNDEIRSLIEAVLKPFGASQQVLLSSLGRHMQKRVKELNETLPHGSASFGTLLLQLLNGRMLSRMSKTYTPNFLRKQGSLDDDSMDLSDCAERYLTRLWDDFGLAKAGYDPARDALGSDPHCRAKIAEHAVLGYPSRDDFEAQLRRDFQLHEQAIGNVDAELLALVPDRVMFLTDTRLPFDNPELLKLTIENFQKVERTEPETQDAEAPSEQVPRPKPPKPVLTGVTWTPVAYRSGALFRGYHHALVIRGLNFTTALQYAYRREGEGFPAGNTDYFWRAPNLLVPNQAEVSVGGDDLEGPLSWRGYQFCVRNSPEEVSDWIGFEYPFDDLRRSAIGRRTATV